jgi:hypothetical protein
MSLSHNNSDARAKARTPRVPKKFSKEKQATIEKIRGECAIAQKQAKHAESQESYFTKKITNTPSQHSDTLFGSTVAEHLFSRTQDKYHVVRWRMAKMSARRRFHRLTKLIERKLG